ncbi:outer membrane usher protein [Acinetobacter calcoaceticus]|uniref:Outer membrane usher protein n=1 Tax=Acinetobacter calcoaceticus TaxID=471 RepID=A0A4R1Y5I0_ACICA|nr:outer membrane usher protein [Acinetobacter calcoaceticus]
MSRCYSPYRFLRRHVRYCLASGIITMALPFMVHAEETSQENKTTETDFNANFLNGDASEIDLSNYKYANTVIPGEYNVDIYVNDQWFGKRRLMFNATEGKKSATTCFTENTLLEYGVKKKLMLQPSSLQPGGCYKIEEWVEHAFYEFDSSRLRVDISIPQIALQQNAQGYIDPSVWDRGINAGFLSYSGGAYKTFYQGDMNDQDNTHAYMSLNAGLNLAGWQFRHTGHWNWQDNTRAGRSKSKYQSNTNYLQRAFPQYRGTLTLGDSNSNGEIFDSFSYRGVDFSSDDRMLPNSMVGYAPQIRGNAKTNAKVEVRQQGQLIYQTTVAPGSFEINDLYPTGFGGELEVSVIEANGDIQIISVPYASVVQMLRPGMNRYSFTLGQFRDSFIDDKPWVGQFKYQHGINNYVTGYTGLQAASDFTSVLIGAAIGTPIGAVAFDVTHSNTDFEKQGSQSGQSYKLSYSKLITPTKTNLTLAAYRYSTENFYNLRDAMLIRDFEERGLYADTYGKQRSEFQITLNQGLPKDWGNFYLIGSWLDYWNTDESRKNYQIGYSNNYRLLSYAFSVNKREIQYDNRYSEDDTEYLMSFSFPWEFKKQRANVYASVTQDSQNVGFSNAVNDHFSYGASMSHQDYEKPSFNTNANYRGNYASVGGSYSYSDQYQQAMLNIMGNVVAHAGGVHFGADQGQTMVLVYAPDAAGAKVNNSPGLSINKAGYAVIPYVTPYRLTDVTLDPQNMSSKVELETSSQRIAPYAGAISKVNFNTKTGYAVYIHTNNSEGKTLPFAAQVYNSKNEVVGIVAQGSMVYLRSQQLKDQITVKWGEGADKQCQLNYDITQQVQTDKQNMIMTEAICK